MRSLKSNRCKLTTVRHRTWCAKRPCKMVRNVLLVLMILYSFDVSTGSPKRSPKRGSPRTPKRNVFNREPFDPCKGTKNVNPVEAVRLNVVATKIVSAIGTDRLSYIASKYKLPATTFYGVGQKLCWIWCLVFGYFSEDGDLSIAGNYTGWDAMRFMESLLTAMKNEDGCVRVRTGTEGHVIPKDACRDMLQTLGPPLINLENGRIFKDGNSILYSIRQLRAIFA